MAYIGNQPTTVAFLTDTFNGTGSQTAYTMTVAPATTSSILVAITGVLQDPSTYSVSGTTLTFSVAPPSGTGNISVRYLGIPASGIATTAYRTQTEFTATAGQTTFTPPSYTVGFIDVYRNGVLLGSADFTATNGTTVVLAIGATAGDLIETVSFFVSSVLNAIPATPGAVNSTYLSSSAAVTSLNGSTGALKGAVLTGTTSISAGSTSVDVTSQMTNAGWYIVNVNLTLSASTSNTDIGFRTSTDNGSTFSSGASDYQDDAYASVGLTSRSFLLGTASGTTNAVAWMNFSILMYTGNGTNPNFFNIQSMRGTSTTNGGFDGRFAWRVSLTQINAIQVVRTSGTRTMSSGTINVYYLGQ
jgi:hypothetical protein